MHSKTSAIAEPHRDGHQVKEVKDAMQQLRCDKQIMPLRAASAKWQEQVEAKPAGCSGFARRPGREAASPKDLAALAHD